MRSILQNAVKGILGIALAGVMLLGFATQAHAQVTTSSMGGKITDDKGEALIGATVLAVHTPSGTRYGTTTNEDGRYILPGIRVGGPYAVTVSYTGYKEQMRENIFVSLGTRANMDVTLAEDVVELGTVSVIANRNDIFSGNRTGAAVNVTADAFNAAPTLSRNFQDFARLVPQARGASFAGQDDRLNNITIDGSIFNNSFGLAGQPGGRTSTAPISLDAIEEIQFNLAPYDVRQSGFVGAGINAVTRSGTNEFSGSVFGNLQNQGMVGTRSRADSSNVTVTDFQNLQAGFRLGGPIIKNKLFFFVNGEIERRNEPFQLRALQPGETAGGNISNVLASDMDRVSDFLRSEFGYETGPYEGYDIENQSEKFLVKLDYNLSDKHKVALRYSHLNSFRDVLVSGSSSLGFGNRSGANSLSFQNSNYIQNENIRSFIAEVNSVFGSKISNKFSVGYTYQNEDRGSRGDFFPLVEIQRNGQTYISTGFEPFTPANKLSYKTFQLQDNLSIFLNKHTITTGLNVERLEFENVFFPGSQGVFVYNSLDNFLTDLSDFKANPNRTVSPVSLRRFQYRYANGSLDLPINEELGVPEPVQPTRVWYGGLYLQDEWEATDNFNLTIGLRADIPFFDETGFENDAVLGMNFNDGGGNDLSVSTAKLPDPKILWSPRVGFNWDVLSNKKLQVRGGTGIFTGRPAFVWISNQIGNNGVLSGFEQIDNTNTRPFTTTPLQFIANPNATPTSYELALTDNDFRFPQVWRSNLAVDAQLPWGLVGTVEFIYNANVNAINYLNINERAATTTFTGVDNRPRYPGSGLTGTAFNNAARLNPAVVNAIYLTNTNEGYAYTATFQLEKRFDKGLFARVAYNYGEAKDLISAGSIAAGSWNGNATVNGNNRADLAFSNNDQRHRILGAVTYRKEYLGFMASQIGLIFEARNQGRFTYVYNQDMNGDGVNGNDLMFVPNNASEIRFRSFTQSGVTFTPEQQVAAYEAYIAQDDYLSSRRGQYAERNGGLLPWLTTIDLSFAQDFYITAGGKRNTLQIRLDCFNFGNLLNPDWGVSQSVIQTRPLAFAGLATDGTTPEFRMQTRTVGGQPRLIDETLQYNQNIFNVYRFQLGLRYTFN
jgi:hypothetical protein